jgi:multidrug efflux pump subunit AcrA (membrane-fusion protein)
MYMRKQLKGKIKTIIPLANEAKAFPVEIEIPNNKITPLMSGMNVSVHFNEDLFAKALSIPRTALLRDVKGNYVYVLDAGKKPLRKMVVPGRDIGTAVEIKAGLAKGDMVISSG